MSRWFPEDGYIAPFLLAVCIHIAAVGILFIKWPSEKTRMAEPIPQFTRASIVQTENKAVEDRRQQQLKAERERRQEIKKAKEKAAKEKAAKEKAAKEKAAKEKAAKEKAAKEKAAKEKAAKEKAAKEKAAKEKAAKEKAAKEKARAEQIQRQEELKQQRQLASVEAMGVIRQQISEVWQYPPNVDARLEVTVRVNCVPTGEVMAVNVISSSGNTALDRSVIQAVRKASPLAVPDDVLLFEQKFRNFTIKFRPENAAW